MQKFFVNSNQINENEIYIKGEDVNHIENVLRLNVEEEVLVGDVTNAKTYLCKIDKMDYISTIIICLCNFFCLNNIKLFCINKVNNLK